MKILLFGSEGQVGLELQRSLSLQGELINCSHNDVDLEERSQIVNVITKHKPEIIVNAAAYTAVDKAETEKDNAYAVNAHAVEVMAELSKKLNAPLIHFSTDYVFDGNKDSAYLEDDAPLPLSVYGESKLQGEYAIKESGCPHLILRTSWVYSLHGNNFIKTILRLAKERDELSVVNDQVGAPTSAEMIADATSLIIYLVFLNKNQQEKYWGTYHLTANDETSWYGFASYIIKLSRELGADFQLRSGGLKAISSEEFPQKAKRPLNSRLNTEKLQQKFKLHLPEWQYHVRRLLTQIYTK